MKTVNTFSVILICRPSKNNINDGLIYARISVNGERKEISLKEKVPISQWNSDKQQLEGRTPQVKALNTHLDNVLFKIKEKYRSLTDKELPVTAQGIKDAYLGIQLTPKGHTLCELITYHFKMEGEKLSPGTMKNYVATEAYIKRFIGFKFQKEDVFLSELNYQFMTELESYIRNHPLKEHDPCKGNGIMKHLERLKKMVHWSQQLGWLNKNPFIEYKLEFKRSKRKKLDLTELSRIEKQHFSNQSIAYVRDLFLFSCYTGLSYADVMALKPENLELDSEGKMWCKIYRQKSDEYAPVPLLQVASAIINKHNMHPKALNAGTVFPYVSNQEVNRNLKIIAEVCSITKYMSFHLARHTFATAVTLKNGVPMETVSKMLGHKKLTTTQIYADVDEEKLNKDMINIDNILLKRNGGSIT